MRQGGKFLADAEMVNDQLSQLEQALRHEQYVDKKKYFADSSFTEQELKQSWDKMPDAERELFSLMVPTQILHFVGVDRTEIAALKEKRKEQFTQDLSYISQGLLDLGEEALAKMGATKSEISLLRSVAKTANAAGKEDKSAPAQIELPRAQVAEVSHAIVNMLVASEAKHLGRITESVRSVQPS